MKILGVYTIIYNNGVKQNKNLIDHSDYLNIIKPKLKEAYELERLKKNKEHNQKMAQKLKNQVKEMFGSEWFTTKSPLYNAIDSGLLVLPNVQGGTTKCKIKGVN